jgi:hypothetical protein
MQTKTLLTPELVDSVELPSQGERWISDSLIKGFGLRLWSGSRAGSKAYAIRIRDLNGRIVRETYDPNQSSAWSMWRLRHLINDGEVAEPAFGDCLESARSWARRRIHWHKGGSIVAERRHKWRCRLAMRIQGMTFDELSDHIIRVMKRRGRSEDYIFNVMRLKHGLSSRTRLSTPEAMDVTAIADEIISRDVSGGNARVLHRFVGQVYKFANRYVDVDKKSEAINRRVARNIRRMNEPLYPAILDITDADFASFFQILERDAENWRSALAIRMYFETGAKMRPVLKAEWQRIVDDSWYPYLPKERKYWFSGAERLNEPALKILDLVKYRQASEGIQSDFLFPASGRARSGHVTTIHRYWAKVSSACGWNGLPLSHVVRKYKRRNTPSYFYSFYGSLLTVSHSALVPDVSKKLEISR